MSEHHVSDLMLEKEAHCAGTHGAELMKDLAPGESH
jgi:hypothetical protein